MTALAPFSLHIAAEPGDDRLQRCVLCGFVLFDNTAWWSPDGVARLDGDDRGPSWWPTGAVIGTDKTDETKGGMTYVKDDGRGLEDDERPCTATVA